MRYLPRMSGLMSPLPSLTFLIAGGLAAVEGPFRGELLQEVPYSTAYDWAWVDFYPDTEIYQP